jgi:DNA-binding NarL/FixJ family response regulator
VRAHARLRSVCRLGDVGAMAMRPAIDAPNSAISIVLVDAEPLPRAGLRALLELHDDLRVVGEASDVREAERLVESAQPRIVLIGASMAADDSVATTRRITGRWPRIQVLVFTTSDEGLVFRILAKVGVRDRTQAALFALRHGLSDAGYPSGC